MTQLSLDSLLVPPQRPTVTFDEATIDAVVTLMADTITAVFHAGGADPDDNACSQP